MKARDIGVVACKVLALYMVVIGLEVFAQFVQTFSAVLLYPEVTVAGALHLLMVFIPIAVMAAGAWLLWWKAGRIGEKMVPEEPAAAAELRAPPGFDVDILTLAFAVCGLVMLAWGIPALVRVLAERLLDAWTQPKKVGEPFNYYAAARITALLVRLLIGSCLLFGARTLARAVSWLRTIGQKPQDREGAA